jgi:hypothetical protein
VSFTQFDRDPIKPSVRWEQFVAALATWVYMQERDPTVAMAAATFNVTGDAIREAVDEHPWLGDSWRKGDPESEQFICCEGRYER